MSQIDREATFRGNIVDHGVSLSTNDFPQWVAQLQATEIYDDEEKVWVDWTDVEEREITAYQILFSSKGETLNAQQIKKAVNWDGISFSSLSDMDLSEVQIQFRVESNTYENKTRLQVNWIDAYDAEPGRSVRKLKPDELKAIDAKYKKYLSSAKKPTPASAKTKDKPKTPPSVKAKGIEPTQKKGPVTQKKGAPDPLGPPEVKELQPPSMPKPPQATGTCTKQEAWDEIVSATKEKRNSNEITDTKLSETWTAAVGKFSNDPDKLTEENWFQVKIEVLDTLVGLPF